MTAVKKIINKIGRVQIKKKQLNLSYIKMTEQKRTIKAWQ